MRDPHYVTLLQLCNDVLRRSWTVVTMVVCCAVAAALLSLARPRTYTSVVSFVPEARQSLPAGVNGRDLPLDRLTGGASRSSPSRADRLPAVGGTPMRLPADAPAQPLDPAFYDAALRSREVLMAVARSRFPIVTRTGVRMATAADFFELPQAPALSRTEDAARRLSRHLEIVRDDRTGMLTVSVRTREPVFSWAVAARLLDVLMERNRQMADSRAEAQIAFLTRVAADARQELRIAQNRLAGFLESNRAYVPASPLAMTYRRLDSDVLEKRRQYADLALQLERAKLDRSRATQLITVVSRPEVPSRPDPRGVVRMTIAGAVGGGALAVLLVLTSAQVRRLRAAGSGDLAVLETEWHAVLRRVSGERRPRLTATTAPTGAQRR
jgi:uncharacterized protein involved in exopolysaccharide biosynthesis